MDENAQEPTLKILLSEAEKSKLLDLLTAEKEEKRALMPPVEEKQKSPN